MAHYIVLSKFTDEGARSIRDIGKMIAANNKVAASQGVKVTRYFTMGEYDLISFVEAPTDEAAVLGLVGVNSRGHLRTTTVKAFTEKEFLGIVAKMPKA